MSINGALCVIVSQTYTDIYCKTPPQSAGTYDIILSQNSKSSTYSSKITYSTSSSPSISSVTPSTANPTLQTVITIAGLNFLDGQTEVILKNADQSYFQNCYILSLTSTEIKCKLNGGETGSYLLYVSTPSGNSGDKNFAYETRITNISSTTGSSSGGNLITITGTNFSTDVLDNQVVIGTLLENYYCDIQSVTSTQIVCMTRPVIQNSILLNKSTDFIVMQKLADHAICDVACEFTYSNANIFLVSAISKSEVMANDVVTFTVDKDLSLDTVKVWLKNDTLKQELTPSEITTTSVSFVMPKLNSGNYSAFVLSQ